MYDCFKQTKRHYDKCIKLSLNDCCGAPGIHFIDEEDTYSPDDSPDYFGVSFAELLQALGMKSIDLLPIYEASLTGEKQDEKLLAIQKELAIKDSMNSLEGGFGSIPKFPSYNEAMVSEMAKIFKRSVKIIVSRPSIIYEASLNGDTKTSEESFI